MRRSEEETPCLGAAGDSSFAQCVVVLWVVNFLKVTEQQVGCRREISDDFGCVCCVKDARDR